jgi:hypothetical protein
MLRARGVARGRSVDVSTAELDGVAVVALVRRRVEGFRLARVGIGRGNVDHRARGERPALDAKDPAVGRLRRAIDVTGVGPVRHIGTTTLFPVPGPGWSADIVGRRDLSPRPIFASAISRIVGGGDRPGPARRRARRSSGSRQDARADDEVVAEAAVADDRILITKDRGFGQLVFAKGVPTTGIIYVRWPVVISREAFLSACRARGRDGRAPRGCVLVLRPARVRVRRRPTL